MADVQPKGGYIQLLDNLTLRESKSECRSRYPEIVTLLYVQQRSDTELSSRIFNYYGCKLFPKL
ncbi:hypothetical protein O9993_13185 [Vibrio lentus]|nr:hypothetical protein [Vibrio lentus]